MCFGFNKEKRTDGESWEEFSFNLLFYYFFQWNTENDGPQVPFKNKMKPWFSLKALITKAALFTKTEE